MILVSFHGGIHIRIPGEKKALYGLGEVLSAIFGIWAFFVLDMQNRLVLRDTGMYWRYPGILLLFANALMMAFFAGLAALMADWLKRKQNRMRE